MTDTKKAYHLTLTSSKTGETLADIETNGFIASIMNAENGQIRNICGTECNSIELLELNEAAKDLLKEFQKKIIAQVINGSEDNEHEEVN